MDLEAVRLVSQTTILLVGSNNVKVNLRAGVLLICENGHRFLDGKRQVTCILYFGHSPISISLSWRLNSLAVRLVRVVFSIVLLRYQISC